MRGSTTPQEQVDFVSNAQRFDPYSNTYNEGWRQHPNFSCGGSNLKPPVTQGPPGFQQLPYHTSPGRDSSSNSSLFIHPNRDKHFLIRSRDHFTSRAQFLQPSAAGSDG
ncbi:unnamed protein product [Linum trigynum]|uniref:Uncharacterized protein n=1 Tax=Linum trigynum TaxID=586398 RepID=A0AAV2DZF2_9ROSI